MIARLLVVLVSVGFTLPALAAGEAIELLGKGAQVYVCDAGQWRLKAPEAVLLDDSGKEVGTHFAGPSWRAADGSVVVGEPLVASPAPQAGSVPWLVLRAKSHEGEGVFAKVAFIARTHTQGGVAPTVGCDAAHAGDEQKVPYSATYTLFPQN